MTLPQSASQIDVALLRSLAQKSLVNVTERPMKVVYVSIQVEIGVRTPEAIIAKALSFRGTRHPRSTLARPKLLAFSMRPDLNRNSTPSVVPK